MTGQVLRSRDDGVVTFTLSQPERRNAISFEMYDRLEDEFAAIAADDTVRALVLRGAAGSFAGGTDIRHLADIHDGSAGVEYEAHMRRVQKGLIDLRIPVVSVVEGACVGGGLVFAALSDLVYCTPDARFGTPIARTLGNTISATSLARLQETFGRRRTAEMLLTGRLLTADEAERAGFVTAVLGGAALEARLGETLQAISQCSPESIWSFKELERRIDAHLSTVEVDDVFARIYGGRQFREGVAAFLGKRAARFVTDAPAEPDGGGR
ncbi:enoyl-CoA hydratase-related protein [Amnibacterium flavum]|uniref:Enoyl-CoA hydratase n=1 Tax=Amnibacterium flavum TaxID=2173173 RepID=A0A2V1HTW7_9MICO|nr:enoyl-CoA hydratase-related protein [Amnibacterium flavum]PVZ94489.1 enoyl-CoA hydratase [Amnibacterium flavum]